MLAGETVIVALLSYKDKGREYYYLDELGEDNGKGQFSVPHFVHTPIVIGSLIRQLEDSKLYMIMFEGEGFSFMQYPGLGFHIVFHNYTIDARYMKILEGLLGNEMASRFMAEALKAGEACTDGLKTNSSDTSLMDFIIDRFHRFQDEQNRIWYEKQIKDEG